MTGNKYGIRTFNAKDCAHPQEAVAVILNSLGQGTPVLVSNLPNATYHDPALGWSSGRVRARIDTRPKPPWGGAANFGQAAHARMTGIGVAPTVFHAPNWRRPQDRQARNQLLRSGGRPLLISEWKKLGAMHTTFTHNPRVRHLLHSGGKPLPEISMFWVDYETGLHLKARPDFLTNTHILEYKTLPPKTTFQKEADQWGYWEQAAWYQQGVAAITGTRIPFTFITQHITAPYRIAIHKVSDETIIAASARIVEELHEIKRELTRGAEV